MIEKNFYRVLNVLLWIVIAFSAAHVLTAYFVERSLWLDEAMLMKSVVTRNFAGILDGMFDYNQSSPPGYMMIVKAITIIFGTEPMALRLFSLLMYFGTAILIFFIARDVLKFKLPWLPVAFCMAIPIVQYYGNEAKPYMAEIFFSLFSIWIYSLYKNGRLSMWWVSGFMALIVWFAFGTLFTMGGICVYHFIYNIRQYYLKKVSLRRFFSAIIPLLLVAASVLAYYILWALPASTNVPDVSENNYWTFLNFPLIPTSLKDLETIARMGLELTQSIPMIILFQFIVGVLYYVYARFRSWLCLSTILTIFMILVVSSMGMYPIVFRLVLSQFIVLWIFAFWTIDYIIGKVAKNWITCMLVVVVLFLPFVSAYENIFNFSKRSFYRYQQEFKLCYEYILTHKSPESKIYFSPTYRPTAEYYTGYKVSSNFSEKNFIESGDEIWGVNFRQLKCDKPYIYKFYILDDELQKNVDKIKGYKDVYVLDVHHEQITNPSLIKALEDSGMEVDTVFDFFGSYVFHCTE